MNSVRRWLYTQYLYQWACQHFIINKKVVHEALSMWDCGKLTVVRKEGVLFFPNNMAIDKLPLLQEQSPTHANARHSNSVQWATY